MSYKTIQISKAVEQIGVITLNRPEKRNALSIQMRYEICECLENWKDIDKLKLPDPGDEKIYDLLKQDINNFPDTAVLLDLSGPLELLDSIRTFENLYMDLYYYREEVIKRLHRSYCSKTWSTS